MKTEFKIMMLLVVIVTAGTAVQAQCYELLWAEEFNYSGYPDPSVWTPEEGGSGWGNNELQYYTVNDTDNAIVENGMLTITARKETFQNKNYTSARLITRGKFNVQYGKIEARMKLPYGQGIWPAFWMLGESFSEVGWPACGEIDIMEMIGGDGRENTVHGTVHWDNNGNHAQYGSSYSLTTGTFADDFHTFAIKWNETEIRWFVDGIQYHVVDITPDGLSEFRDEFFILLNLAVGGNWPGYPDASTVFPQTLEVDYVRVYKKSEEIAEITITGEDVIPQKASATDFSVPYSPGLTYNWTVPEDATILSGQDSSTVTVNWGCGPGEITCEITGACDTYLLSKDIELKNEIYGPMFVAENQQNILFYTDSMVDSEFTWSVPGDATIISGQGTDSITVNWGNTFENVQLSISSTCGVNNLEFPVTIVGQYPYPDIQIPHQIPGVIEATAFDYGGAGVAYNDNTIGNLGDGPRQDTDVDTEYNDNGSPNVGWIRDGEWLEYTIRVDSSAYYEITMRVATATAGGPFSFQFNGEERLSGINVENTSGWDSFKTVTAGTVYLTTADTLMRVSFNSGGFNLGKMTFTTTTEPDGQVISESIARLRIYPVPATNFLTFESSDQVRAVTIYDINGRAVLQLKNINAHKETISISDLPPGVHMLKITTADGNSYYDRIIKLTYN